MFFDGIRYANVARNYAEGFGSFWRLYYGTSEFTPYPDQPPLVFFLQGIFFKVFGDSIYTERIYDGVFAILHVFLIIKLWKELTGKSSKYFWLPVLFWVIIPLTSWTFKNNLHEVTMGAFDLAAVLFLVRGCSRKNHVYLLSGSMLILLASMCKGFQGLFPITIPFLYWLIYRERSFGQAIIQTLSVLSVIVIAYVYFYLTPEIRESISAYFKHRIEATFNHVHDTKKSYLYLLYKLILELMPPIILTAATWVASQRKKPFVFDTSAVCLMMFIGISASFPLMITLEQRAFYLTTSLPYFVIALALITLPNITPFIDSRSNKKFSKLNILLVSLIIIAVLSVGMFSKNPKRDHALLHDLYVIKSNIPEASIVSIPNSLHTNWAYHAYFMRYGKITLDHIHPNRYYLIEETNLAPSDTCYKKMDLELRKFSVFECALR